MTVMTTTTVDSHAIVRQTLDNGGATISVETGESPSSGYLVSLPGYEVTVDKDSFTSDSVDNYVSAYREILSRRNTYLGTWVDGDLVYLDSSIRIADGDTAEDVGRAFSQLAIYNVNDGSVISL